MNDLTTPQIKICGLTDIDEAARCAALGADAIGLVFYPKSPRHISNDQARRIIASLPPGVSKTGVFVDAGFSDIMRTVDFCGLDAVQLHGIEPPDLVLRLASRQLIVIKALFISRYPKLSQAGEYNASAFLVELGEGRLPGGNAMPWQWSDAADYEKRLPLILAGGLSPDNIARALEECPADGVDVSSGVEQAPGRKDLNKVKRFIDSVRGQAKTTKLKPIF